MRNFTRFAPLAWVMVLLPIFSSCGGGKTPLSEKQAAVTVAIVEDSVNLGAGESYQFTATVTGTSNAAVTWTISGCTGAACGSISPTGLYTAPSVLAKQATVTVTATSQADSSKSDSVAVNHMAISVSIAPVAVWVTPGETLHFTSSVRYDYNHAGVTWALAPGCSNATCGTLSNVTVSSVTFNAPATVPNPSTVTLIAASITDPGKSAVAPITVSVSRALAAGDYAFSFTGWEIHYTSQGFYNPYHVAAAGHFHADSSGNITDGIQDISLASGIRQAVPFTGTYSVGPDQRGSFTITSAQGTATYRMAVDASGSKASFVKFDNLPSDGPISGTGYLEVQDKASFSLAGLAGPHAIGMFGTSEEWNRLAAVGRFTASNAGALSSGKMDVTVQTHAGADPQSSATNLMLTGSLSAPAAGTGRGTGILTLSQAPDGTATNWNFAYYIISEDKILLVQTDTRSSAMPVLSGEVRRQNGPFSAASFNGPGIFSMTGVDRSNYGPPDVNAAVGQMVTDGSGFLMGVIDDDRYQGGTNQAFTGSYSVDPDGRATMTLQLGSGNPDTEIAYFFGQNEAFLMQTSGQHVMFGSIRPQAPGPFTVASVSGTFLTATAAPAGEFAENASGFTIFDGTGGIISTMDVTNSGLHHFDLTGTYTVAANGRGTLTFTSPSTRSLVFWAISPAELVGTGTLDPSSYTSTLLQYKK